MDNFVLPLPITTGLKKRYSNQTNSIIAIISIVMGIVYIVATMPAIIEQFNCPTCKFVAELSLHHYWYRWCLSVLLIFSGYRLIMRFIGTRRLYYIFFTSIVLISIHDLFYGISAMNIYDILIYGVAPFIISTLGFIYFLAYYKSSLKHS